MRLPITPGVALALFGRARAACAKRPSPSQVIDGTVAVGINPISIASVRALGEQGAKNSCSHRDLGFAGRIGGRWYSVFGDTLWCSSGETRADSDQAGFHGMVRNSISLLTADPLTVMDLHLDNAKPIPHQQQLVPFNADWNETCSTASAARACARQARVRRPSISSW